MAAVASNTSTPFERALESTNIPKHDINNLVMDFFVQQGYPEAAARFAEEANVPINAEDTLMAERVSIRDAIHRGDLEVAIEEINAIDTQLIEMIKNLQPAPEAEKPALVREILTFAQQNLSPYAPQNEEFKTDLERAMALMIVPAEAWRTTSGSNSPYATAFGPLSELVDSSLKRKVAADVNSAILKYQGKRPDTALHKILQTRAWSENLARDKRVDLPRDLKISLLDSHNETQSQNGNGDTQMTEDADDGARDAEQRYTNIHESQR